MPDFRGMKLGKAAAKFDDKRLMLGKYLVDLPAPPTQMNWGQGITDWGELGNNRLGNCTIVDIEHGLQVAMSANGVPWDDSVSEATAIKYYSMWCGYDPADSANTDEGGVIIDELNTWRKTDFAGHKLIGYADPTTTDSTGAVTFNLNHIKQSIALFSGVSIGLQLPITASNQDVWDVVGDPLADGAAQPGSWGGHAVYCPAYDPVNLTCITWGLAHKMTWNFFLTYADEAHTLFMDMWLKNQTTPSGFTWAQLLADLQQVTG